MIQTNYRTIEKKWIQWNVNKETNKQNKQRKMFMWRYKRGYKKQKN